MSDHDAFLKAILADPGNDDPRLVYADWLDELGQSARAEFIRLQIRQETKGMPRCDLATVEGCDDCRRERELLFAREPQGLNNGLLWLGFRPLTAQMRGEGEPSVAFSLASKSSVNAECYYRRGFVERLFMPAIDFQRGHVDILGQAPVTRVELTTWPVTRYAWGKRPGWNRKGRLLHCPWLRLDQFPWYPGNREECDRHLARVTFPGIELTLPPLPVVSRGAID